MVSILVPALIFLTDGLWTGNVSQINTFSSKLLRWDKQEGARKERRASSRQERGKLSQRRDSSDSLHFKGKSFSSAFKSAAQCITGKWRQWTHLSGADAPTNLYFIASGGNSCALCPIFKQGQLLLIRYCTDLCNIPLERSWHYITTPNSGLFVFSLGNPSLTREQQTDIFLCIFFLTLPPVSSCAWGGCHEEPLLDDSPLGTICRWPLARAGLFTLAPSDPELSRDQQSSLALSFSFDPTALWPLLWLYSKSLY